MKPLGDSVPLGQVKVPVHAETKVVEYDVPLNSLVQICTHEVIALWDSNGHNFLDIIGYHHPDELQIVVDLMNNYAPIVYAARDLLEYGTTWKGGEQSKLLKALEIAVNGKPNMEEEDDEEYTLGEILFDL